MPRRKQDADVEFHDDAVGADTTAKPERAPRLSIPLTSDGGVDFSAVRPATLEKLKQAVKAGGIVDATVTGEIVEEYPRKFIPPLYDGITTAVRSVGKIFFKWPADFAELIRYTDEEKENLKEPTGMFLDKHAPALLKKYAVEINFLNALAANTGSMVQRAVGTYAEKARAAQPRTVQVPKAEDAPAEIPIYDVETAGAAR